MPRRRDPDPLSRRIGERIRELRLEAGLTLEKLAYESALGSKGHLSDLERGLAQPTVGTLQTLALHLGVLLIDLVTFREDGARSELLDETRKMTSDGVDHVVRLVRADAKAARPEPFRILARQPRTAGRAIPLYDFEAAAGAFRGGAAVEPKAWVVPKGPTRLRAGMFVAVVTGRSMEPRIPHGSYCIFIAPVRGIPSGRIVLAEHRSTADPETGGSYSVKSSSSRSRREGACGHGCAWSPRTRSFPRWR